MLKKQKNHIDNIIDKLFNEFAKADLVRKDENLLSLVLVIIKHFAEIQDFKVLFKNYFIPQASRATVALKSAVKNSRYKKLFKNELINLDENKNETIRLGLVGLWHKYESFRGELIIQFNQFLNSKNSSQEISNYAQSRYGFNIKESWRNNYLFEVNWLCNRIKHDSALPVNRENPNKEIPSKFQNLNPEFKIVLSEYQLYEYIDGIYEYCQNLFQLYNYISLELILSNPEEYGATNDEFQILQSNLIQSLMSSLNNRISKQ